MACENKAVVSGWLIAGNHGFAVLGDDGAPAIHHSAASYRGEMPCKRRGTALALQYAALSRKSATCMVMMPS